MPPDSLSRLDLGELKRAYARNENVSRLIRDFYGNEHNEQLAIQLAYDLQAGSYIAGLADEERCRDLQRYASELAAVLARFNPASLLEAGVGEATTLLATAQALGDGCAPALFGFDLSWSRVHFAQQYWREHSALSVDLFMGELEAIPLPAESIDVVFTSHAVEPNHGREREILTELYRVTRRALVLLEPAYELATAEARARMDHHGYCRGLLALAEEAGWCVTEHRLFGFSANPLNPTGLWVIEKPATPARADAVRFACPICRTPLVAASGHYFCEADGLVFPVLREIACLLRSSGIIASKFLD